MGKSAHLRWQRERLWNFNPRCHWCGQVTVLPGYHGRMKDIKDNWATIEHLDARHSPERGMHFGEFRHVLACWKCNNERDQRETKAIPVQTLWERNGQLYDIAKRSGALNEVEA